MYNGVRKLYVQHSCVVQMFCSSLSEVPLDTNYGHVAFLKCVNKIISNDNKFINFQISVGLEIDIPDYRFREQTTLLCR